MPAGEPRFALIQLHPTAPADKRQADAAPAHPGHPVPPPRRGHNEGHGSWHIGPESGGEDARISQNPPFLLSLEVRANTRGRSPTKAFR